MNPKHKRINHQTDFCVIGGGLAGMFAAIQAARKGLNVVLIQDRPVLGGNASSEIRMWPRGCHGRNNQETGLYEEMLCENMYRNPNRNYSIWDSVLYGMVKQERNLTVLLNTSVYDATMSEDKKRIVAVEAWQLTTYTVHSVEAKLFSDCSGDSILATLTGAEYSVGREASSEFGESIQPDKADKKTMGMTCMMQARETDKFVPFTPPKWARKFTDESMFKHREHHMSDKLFNYWWIELGGDQDSLYDTETVRDDLLATAFGVWDHIKNHGDHAADNWELDWVGFLPGKRESRRYKGQYVLTENDILNEGRFDDIVAYGGWTMDDHDPAGFNADGPPNVFHPAPTPYGIPYRCLYSNNVENLFFAGRNISATHAALSSTRVMATCAIMGQAVGMAAALAFLNETTPHGVYKDHLETLQNNLMLEDCYLPFTRRKLNSLTQDAELSTTDTSAIARQSIENIRNGFDRPIGDHDNGAYITPGKEIIFHFSEAKAITSIRIVFDSDINRDTVSGDPELRWSATICNRHLDFEPFGFPTTMTRSYQIQYQNESGEWQTIIDVNDNYQRQRQHELGFKTSALRVKLLETYGSPMAHVFAIDLA